MPHHQRIPHCLAFALSCRCVRVWVCACVGVRASSWVDSAFLRACVHVCVRTRVVRAYVRACARARVRASFRAWVRASVRTFSAWVRACMCVRACACVHVRACVRACARAHACNLRFSELSCVLSFESSWDRSPSPPLLPKSQACMVASRSFACAHEQASTWPRDKETQGRYAVFASLPQCELRKLPVRSQSPEVHRGVFLSGHYVRALVVLAKSFSTTRNDAVFEKRCRSK